MLVAIIGVLVWAGSGCTGLGWIKKAYSNTISRSQQNWQAQKNSQWLQYGDRNAHLQDDEDEGERSGGDRDDENDNKSSYKSWTKTTKVKRASQWDTSGLLAETIDSIKQAMAQYYPGYTKFRITEKKTRVKNGCLQVSVRAEFKWQGTEIEVATVAVYSRDRSVSTSAYVMGEEAFLQTHVKRQQGTIVTDVQFYAEGKLNVAGISTQWQDATVSGSSYLETGDMSQQGYLDAIGSGTDQVTIASDNYVYGQMHIEMAPK